MLNPWMLLGLLGLAAPIVIHLIQRQRLRPQPLATLQFLDQEDVANAFAPLPRDVLQLLLRLVLLGLFVLLMCRLFIGSSEPAPRTMSVILDQSMSMQRKVEKHPSLFAQQQTQILELIDGMRPGDKMALTLVGDRVAEETGYLEDPKNLREIVEAWQVSDSGALALMPAVRSAVNRLRSRREANASVLVFSDHQRLNYSPYLDELRGAADDDSAKFKAALAASDVQLVLIDDAPPAKTNLSIESARLTPERAYVGSSSRLTAVVRNDTDQPQVANLTLLEGDQAGAQRALNLAPGETAHLDLVHQFDSPLDSAVRVEIEEDDLPGDDRFHLPMRMKDRRQVLLVAPSDAEGDAENSELELSYRGADLLSYALNPGESLGAGAGTFVNVKRVTPAQLGRVSLPLYSMIVLYGAVELPEQSIDDLVAFVKNGGGVWLAPDRELAPLRFNEAFAPLLRGFQLGQLKEPEDVQRISRDEALLGHPLLLPLVREEWGPVGEVDVAAYFTVENRGEAQAALAAESKEWLAAVVPLGEGQVFLQLTPNDLESSSLPRTPLFVPLVQQIISRLGAQHENAPPDVLRAGEVHRTEAPEFRGLQGAVEVSGPAQHKFPLSGERGDQVVVQNLTKAGAYQLAHPLKKSGRTRWITVNPVLGESRLAALSVEEQTELLGDVNVARTPFADLHGLFRSRHELTIWLIVLVMAAFAVEALAGAWQSRSGARRKPQEAAA